MRLLNRRSTIAPTAFAEHEDYMIKGDKFEKVLTFWEYPTEFRSIADILFLVKAFFHHSADFSAGFSPFCPIAA